MMQKSKITIAALFTVLAAGCGVDKDDPKYDQLRYEQLAKTRCVDMAALLSSEFVNADPEDYENSLKRCEDMKSLSFEEYKKLADYSRANGTWDIYQLYPEKRNIIEKQ